MLVHGLVWLTHGEGGIVATGDPAAATVVRPEELTEATYELHWFGSAATAGAFASGINHTGINTIYATQGQDGAEGAVIVCRMDRTPASGKTLDDVVQLFAHVDPAPRKASTKWHAERSSLLSTTKYPYSSFSPISISKETADYLQFRFWFDRWKDHPDAKAVAAGSVQGFKLIQDDRGKWLCWSIMEELRTISTMGKTRSLPWRERLADMVRPFKGEIDDDRVRFLVDADITAVLTRIAGSFRMMYALDGEAHKEEYVRKVYEDENVQRLLRALDEGGSISTQPSPRLIRSSGKEVKLTQKIVHELMSAGLILEDTKQRNIFRLAPGVEPLKDDAFDVGVVPTL